MYPLKTVMTFGVEQAKVKQTVNTSKKRSLLLVAVTAIMIRISWHTMSTFFTNETYYAGGNTEVNAKVAKCLKGIMFLTLIYNSILRLIKFPTQWKCAEIVTVSKPGKVEDEITISLLSLFYFCVEYCQY